MKKSKVIILGKDRSETSPLLPCPFCGHLDLSMELYYLKYYGGDGDKKFLRTRRVGFIIHCHQCNTNKTTITSMIRQAYVEWNVRKPMFEIAQVVKEHYKDWWT